MRTRLLLAVLLAASLLGGCARSASSDGVSRLVSPTITDDVGHSHYYGDGQRYMRYDP